MSTIMVTGGAGFIGSHTVIELIEQKHRVVVADDLSNGSAESLRRVRMVTGADAELEVVDLTDWRSTLELFRRVEPDATVHFAAMKHVRQSKERPLDYYRTNLSSTMSVLEAAVSVGCDRFIFSSSGSIYGEASMLPIPESAEHRPTNPYSVTKSVGERMVADAAARWPDLRCAALRYFNPAGAHPSGLLGEDPVGLLSNLVPVLMHVAIGNLAELEIFGDDFDTPDGFGVRDYVHVCDVAKVHTQMLDQLTPGFRAFNLGRGVGVSVKEMVEAVERVTGKRIPTRIEARRPGDVAALYGDATLLDSFLGEVHYADLETICADAWRWQSKNPLGFRTTGRAD